ncbi:hypothetical protein PV326_004371 [Microctonus aethiopoides]|nr:hypothetical protein PV326_004371 [Microctonus aethiopoides]
MATPPVHIEKDLDLSNAGRGVWLVKVPKYIANKWEKAPGNIEVGKLKITKNPGQKAAVSLKLSEAVLALKDPDEEDIPKQHRLDVSTVTRQMLGVFSHLSPNTGSESIVPETEKLYMEGRIVQKLECRPYADKCYMKLKLEKKKKAEGKKMRDDKDAVLDMLFAAFEKHQYYNIRDLVKITRQPIVYLKEILNEVCNYNLKNPHRNMWELKPEYRHYNKDEKAGDGGNPSTAGKSQDNSDDSS